LRNFGIVEICRDVERGLTCNEGKLLPLPIISSTCIYSIVAKEVLTLSEKPLPFFKRIQSPRIMLLETEAKE
jgi:hypothetical protein